MKIIGLFLFFAFPLVSQMNVLIFAGSTRDGSLNKKLSQEAADVVGRLGAKVTWIDLKDYPMPFYDADLEEKSGMPKYAAKLRELMARSDAILIASPEYNGSVPAILKNAIDWASRKNGSPSREAFEGKKFFLMSASPGPQGGARGLVHLRAILENLHGEVAETQFTVPAAHQAFSDNKISELTAQLGLNLKKILAD